MQICTIANYIKKQTPTYMTIYGGMTKQKELVDAFTQTTTDFLLQNKGKTLSIKDIMEFYKKIFPKIKLTIKTRSEGVRAEFLEYQKNHIKQNEKISFWEKHIVLKRLRNTDGLCETKLDKKKENVEGFELQLPDVKSSWIMKKVFGIKRKNEGKFFVDKEFANVFLHEGVHLVQNYLKPSGVANQRIVLKYAKKDKLLTEKLMDICGEIYKENIYIKGFKRSRRSLVEDVLKELKKPVENSDGKLYQPDNKLVMAQIKDMIRSFKQEKQAFEKGERIVYKFKYPWFEKFNFLRKYTDKKVKEMLGNYFYFDEKIKILKDIYLDLAKQERAKIGLVK